MDRECRFVDVVAFVKMKSTFHRNNVLAGKLSAHELAFVAQGGAMRKVRDFLVGNFFFCLDLLGELAGAGAQDYSEPWRLVPTISYELGRLVNC